MNNSEFFSEKKKSIWISTTGYRTLLILKLLMQKERTLDELVELIKADIVVQKSISKDTVRVAINTLRKIGCEIPRPSRTNQYKYELVSHPFVFVVSDEQFNALLRLKEILCEKYSWDKVLLINDLYSKIFSLTKNQSQIEYVENSKSLACVDRGLLIELTNKNLINKKIEIEYNSVKYGKEILEVVPLKFTFENGKLYLVCYNFKYQHNSILNVERILKLVSVNLSETYENNTSYEVVYKLENEAFKIFELKDNEEIIEKTKDSITVKAVVLNEFLFVQRILLFATDVQLISPSSFKQKILDKLKLLKRGYENE